MAQKLMTKPHITVSSFNQPGDITDRQPKKVGILHNANLRMQRRKRIGRDFRAGMRNGGELNLRAEFFCFPLPPVSLLLPLEFQEPAAKPMFRKEPLRAGSFPRDRPSPCPVPSLHPARSAWVDNTDRSDC